MGTIYLIRHGQASFGKEDYDQLSVLGIEQSEKLGEFFSGFLGGVDYVVCGAMKRHEQTASSCLQRMGLQKEWACQDAWNEFDGEAVVAGLDPKYSERMGLAKELMKHPHPGRAFQELFEKAVVKWVSGEFNSNYSETWTDFRKRVLVGFQNLTENLGKEETALVFTSGGPVTVVVQNLLGLGDSEAVRLNWRNVNGGFHKIVVGRNGAFLSTFNGHPHLEGEGGRLLTYR